MPMRKTQRVQAVRYGANAVAVIERLAKNKENIDVADVIRDLGRKILSLDGVGLRGPIKTYDIAFVGRKAFASFIAPSHQGKWTPSSPNILRVGVLIPIGGIQDSRGVLRARDFDRQGWHDVYVDRDRSNVDIAFHIVMQAHSALD